MNTQTIYEFPLNERVRVFMRLEQLFQQLNHFMAGGSVFDKRAAIDSLLDILTIFGRSDLKSELIKELERHSKVLGHLSQSEEVDRHKLQTILDQLSQASRKLYNASGKIGISVLESGLFQSISQRSAIPGGTYSFDLPAFHYWLEQDAVQQQKDLETWTQPFVDIQLAIDLILGFIRQSCVPRQELAHAGFFQLALDKNHPVQLLRVGVPKAAGCFAEISGGKHRFSIRFLLPSTDENRPVQTQEDVVFNLARCAV
ncbi:MULTISPECIES: cell division protein ZapD [Methylomonas]|uniref:cell division protein ZapD n=1 Tax=Methylomonas TaxID=416 RepID=UPI001231A4BD|nr:cell division protein ZapD [Methylomonas rhizoryzae]